MPSSVIINDPITQDQFLVILRRMEADLGILVASNINTIISNPLVNSNQTRQMAALELTGAEDPLRGLITRYLQNISEFLFSRIQLVEFIKWLGVAGAEVNPAITDAQIPALNFIVSAIYAGELIDARLNQQFDDFDANESPIERLRKFLPISREWSMWAMKSTNPYHSLARAQIVLAENMLSQLPSFLTTFKEETQLDLSDFLTCSTAIYCMCVTNESTNAKLTVDKLSANCPHYRTVFETFIENFAFSLSDLQRDLAANNVTSDSPNYGYKFLRNKPIFKSYDGTLAIVDLEFFRQFVAVGPLFKTFRLGASRVFGEFGFAFERYAQWLLDGFNIARPTEFQAFQKNNPYMRTSQRHRREISDITLTYSDCIVLIECKAVWLNNEELARCNDDEFWNIYKTKYGVTPPSNGNDEDRKGIAQLCDSIKELAEPQSAVEDPQVFHDKIKTIIPVLLVHDSLLSATGFANLLATEFAQLFNEADFSPTGYFNHKDLEISNLVVMTIDELESLVSTTLPNSLKFHLESFNEMDPSRVHKSVQDYVFEKLNQSGQRHPLESRTKVVMNRAMNLLFPHDFKKTIAETAYFKWLDNGRKHGFDQNDWFEAEKSLLG